MRNNCLWLPLAISPMVKSRICKGDGVMMCIGIGSENRTLEIGCCHASYGWYCTPTHGVGQKPLVQTTLW